ncbi:hypothetical protein [Lampropedia cohaerens]|uniref:hypothetical protein n=1 Tax=Lampropedia cohaerens TaxID=1610491 RepID=UPI001E63F554|nr:hypothetical protein [Lampropedia cohaerens]
MPLSEDAVLPLDGARALLPPLVPVAFLPPGRTGLVRRLSVVDWGFWGIRRVGRGDGADMASGMQCGIVNPAL